MTVPQQGWRCPIFKNSVEIFRINGNRRCVASCCLLTVVCVLIAKNSLRTFSQTCEEPEVFLVVRAPRIWTQSCSTKEEAYAEKRNAEER